MAESLLSPSGIRLYGREFPGFSLANLPANSLGDNNLLRKQIEAAGAKFARIYAFSNEGNFYNLSKPAIFLVHGDGEDILGAGSPDRGGSAGGITDQSGLVARDFGFERSGGFPPPAGTTSVADGVRCWAYDKEDFSLRLEVTTGSFEDILLEAEIETQLQISSAARVQISGGARMQISHSARMQIARRSGG